ncbi:MAG: hypothetical protein QW727_01825 [Candidatus Pacearchaeota archaeon]
MNSERKSAEIIFKMSRGDYTFLGELPSYSLISGLCRIFHLSMILGESK